jgi:hypothetical protein
MTNASTISQLTFAFLNISVIASSRGSVAAVKKIPFYVNDCEPIKNIFIENQGFMILDCPGFD